MDEDQWTYDNTMPQEVDMDYENEEECGVNQPHVDCWDFLCLGFSYFVH